MSAILTAITSRPRRRVSSQARRRLSRFAPFGLIGPAAIVVAVGALAPIIVLILYSFGVLGQKEPVGLSSYREILGDDYFRKIFVKSIRIAVTCTALSLVVAVPLAFVISRSRGWARTLLASLVVLPLLVNIVVRNLGWVLALSPNGVLNQLLAPFGIEQNLLGTLSGIGVVLVHVSIPLIVLPLLASIDQIQPSQREAAQSLGAHPLVSFVRITLPSIAPGMVAGATLSFVVGVGSLVSPMFLGQGRVNVIPTLIVQQISSYRWERAAALSLLLFVLVVVVVVTLQRLAVRLSRGRTVRSRSRGRILPARLLTMLAAHGNGAPSLERTRRHATRVYVGLMTVFLLFPMAIIVKTGIDDHQVPQAGFSGFTWKWIGRAFSEDGYRTQLLFSLRLAIFAVVIGLLLSVAASWALVRFRFPGRDGVVAFLMSPLLVPQAALAVGFVLFFLILGTEPSFARLLFAHVLVTIPYMTRVLVSTFETVDVRMEEAASAMGARPTTVFRRITLPIVRSGIFTASLFGFLTSFDEAAVSVLVASGETTTLPVKLLSDMSFQPTPVGAAISTVLITLVIGIVVPLERKFGIASSAVASR